MSTESLRRQVADMMVAAGAGRRKHVVWLPDGAAELARLRAAGVPETDILCVQWLPEDTPEPKSEDS